MIRYKLPLEVNCIKKTSVRKQTKACIDDLHIFLPPFSSLFFLPLMEEGGIGILRNLSKIELIPWKKLSNNGKVGRTSDSTHKENNIRMTQLPHYQYLTSQRIKYESIAKVSWLKIYKLKQDASIIIIPCNYFFIWTIVNLSCISQVTRKQIDHEATPNFMKISYFAPLVFSPHHRASNIELETEQKVLYMVGVLASL